MDLLSVQDLGLVPGHEPYLSVGVCRPSMARGAQICPTLPSLLVPSLGFEPRPPAPPALWRA